MKLDMPAVKVSVSRAVLTLTCSPLRYASDVGRFLERDIPAQRVVVGEVHDAESTGPDDGLDLELAQPGYDRKGVVFVGAGRLQRRSSRRT